MNKNSLRWITVPVSKDKIQYFLEQRDNETLSFHLFKTFKTTYVIFSMFIFLK